MGWQTNITNKFKRFSPGHNILRNAIFGAIEKVKDYLKTLEPMATENVLKIFRNCFKTSKPNRWIGRSICSNNTKTKNHKIIKPNDFSGNYIHYIREHAMCGIMNGISSQRFYTIRWNFFILATNNHRLFA